MQQRMQLMKCITIYRKFFHAVSEFQKYFWRTSLFWWSRSTEDLKLVSLSMLIRTVSLCSLKTIGNSHLSVENEVGTFGVRDKSVLLGEVFYFTFPHLFLTCKHVNVTFFPLHVLVRPPVLSHVPPTLFLYLFQAKHTFHAVLKWPGFPDFLSFSPLL